MLKRCLEESAELSKVTPVSPAAFCRYILVYNVPLYQYVLLFFLSFLWLWFELHVELKDYILLFQRRPFNCWRRPLKQTQLREWEHTSVEDLLSANCSFTPKVFFFILFFLHRIFSFRNTRRYNIWSVFRASRLPGCSQDWPFEWSSAGRCSTNPRHYWRHYRRDCGAWATVKQTDWAVFMSVCPPAAQWIEGAARLFNLCCFAGVLNMSATDKEEHITSMCFNSKFQIQKHLRVEFQTIF